MCRVQVVDTDSDARLLEEAVAIAKRVCAGNAAVTRQVREMIHSGFGAGVREGVAREGATAISAYERMAEHAAATRSTLAAKFGQSSKL